MIFTAACHFPIGLSNKCRNFLVISDETAFAMNGMVSTRDVRQFVPVGNPPAFDYEGNVSRENVNAWSGMFGYGVLPGPF